MGGIESPELVGLPEGIFDHEVVARGRVELRLGEPRRDSKELARLFTQESTLPHLAGIVPHRLSEDERQEIDSRYPGIPLLAATSNDVGKYYQKNKDQILIVAKSQKAEGKLSGAVVVQRGNVGVTVGNISKLVVDEDERGQRIGVTLVRAANAFIFDYLKQEQAIATVILNVPNDHIPQRVFRGEGFKSQTEVNNRCVSWDTETEKLVVRNALPFVLERDTYFKRENINADIALYRSALYDFPKSA